MSHYGKCGYCGTDLTRIAELRTDARFCSKEHQATYWKDKRKIDRQINVALGAIEKLREVAASDTLLSVEAQAFIDEIGEAVLSTRQPQERT